MSAAGGGSSVTNRLRFASKYSLERPVEVEVVAAEIREAERGEADSREPSETRTVRRRLHRAAPVAHVEHLPQRPLDVDRLRRRAQGGPPLAADAALDRPEQPGSATGGGEDREQEEARRRLAVRAR